MWIHNCKYTQVHTKCIVWVCKSRITHTEIQEVHISGLFWFIALRCPYSSALTDQEMVILQNCWSNLWWIHDPRTAVPPHSGKWKKSFLNVFWLWRETNLVLNINVLTHCVCTPACLCACMYERRSGDTLILFEWLWMQSVTLLWKSDEEEGDLKECVGWRTLKSDDL